ncbi:conserved hypothetical protein [Sphingomonas sp. EC-HK361]|uniref:hypothetical protein n=1 Tax=Sphingomonas sp. EC-HK361 TaxID=2038397 RepID=UPI0012562BA4|nr:hypothetical protein [Sphingomonas sp. EC-HK361]VVT02972.1 conserved hypothetical protein [Sphingomonas sp. EC-HK361]
MTDETPAERAEAAATRRRWISLAEVVAVAGVLIAALTLWNSWSERRDAALEKASAAAQEERVDSRIALVATVENGGDRLRLRDTRHEIADVTVTFPKALGVPTQQPVEPVIDSGAFRDALLKATDNGPDAQTGKLPALVRVIYWDGDTKRTGAAIYDIIWRTEGRILRGRSLKLEALRLRDRSGNAAALDRMWTPPA